MSLALLALLAAAPVAMPDLTANLPTGQCNNGPGNEGADSYFHGSFTLSGDMVSGAERWLLTANPKWEARGGKSCEVKWTVSGKKVSDTGACASCSFGLQFHAEPDLASSECPEELLIGRLLPDGRRVGGEATAFDQTYAIAVGADGVATFYFAKSGKRLGQGYKVGNRIDYVTDHQCKWF